MGKIVKNVDSRIIIDAENAVLGRLASYAVKQSLRGKTIIIVNSEEAIITGSMENIKENYKKKMARRSNIQRGPNFPSLADRILKRTIRGMLPYKKQRGADAFKRIKCYIGIPESLKNEKMIKSGKEKHGEYLSLKDVSREIR